MFFFFFSLGVLISYAANHNVSAQIKNTRRFINTNLRDLKTLANNTPSVSTAKQKSLDNVRLIPLVCNCYCGCVLQQIEYLTAQYTTAKNKVLSDLDSKRNFARLLRNESDVHFCLSVVKPCNPFCVCLTDIGPLLGGRIHNQLEKEVVPSLDSALRMAGGRLIITHALNKQSKIYNYQVTNDFY